VCDHNFKSLISGKSRDVRDRKKKQREFVKRKSRKEDENSTKRRKRRRKRNGWREKPPRLKCLMRR